MKPILLLGAPGTGKTYQLVERIRQTKPNKFALISFTKQAANEAKRRLRTYYKESELNYVRTIHSLCFELLTLKTTQVVTFKYLKQFGNEYGYEFTGRYHAQEDDTYNFLTEDDIEFRQMQIDVVKMNQNMHNGEMYNRYVAYKTKNNLVDYNDMILNALEANIPSFDLLCVDEIQDLTPLQLRFIIILASRAKQIIFAGDDNQMIFEWAGVDRHRFMQLATDCSYEILNDNYRIKGKINNLAHKIVAKQHSSSISFLRIDSNPLNNIKYISEEPLDFNAEESYLILARNGYLLAKVIQGLEYINCSWDWLYENSKLSKIKLSTIHGAKGSEADNVILLTDVSPATYENIDNDSEHRVWYVGITRARKKLYIIQPQTDVYYDLS